MISVQGTPGNILGGSCIILVYKAPLARYN